MSARSSRFVVPGEDLSPAVAVVFAAVGAASAIGSALAFAPKAAEPASPAALPVAPAPKTPETPPSSQLPPPSATTAAPSASVAAPPRCPALVINFKSGMASPPPGARPRLAELAAWLVAHPDVAVVIDGHADSSGNEDGNLRLSRQRASFVGAALEGAGVDHARVGVRGFGSFWPVDESPPDASWNRRVVVQTKGSACPREREEIIEP